MSGTTTMKILALQNAEQIELAASKAIEHGFEIPVVLVLDPSDESARAIIRESGRECEVVIDTVDNKRRGLNMTVVLWYLPARIAANLLRPFSQETADGLVPLAAPNMYYLVVVAQGMTLVGAFPLP